ncbi:MAG: amino acid adenylation domain-containing protein [bacterium]|nr:amino acid adenylation domain-containing protein [bacterium]
MRDRLLTDMFMEQVDRKKNETALIAADGELTYGELNAKANRIANALIARGVRPGDRVMMMLPRTSSLAASILGILKAGAAYIPVDPEYPAERIAYVRSDSEARYIITDQDIPQAADIQALLAEGNEEEPPRLTMPATNPCYLIYTSGSTGRPKGVVITHQGITNYVEADPQNIFPYEIKLGGHVFLTITTVAFDVFTSDFFMTLTTGLTLVLTDEEGSKNPYQMANLIRKHHVDIISGTPTRLLQYLKIPEYAAAVAQCGYAFIAGEAFPDSLLRRLKETTGAVIYNGYGPTEISVVSNIKKLTDVISIGKPLLNVYECIRDPEGKPVAQGEKGELYIGGRGVSPGYVNLEELNSKKFVEIDGIRYFKSGDTAFVDENGDYHIIGRMDHQVKLRGLRIELGEIDSLIAEYPGILSNVTRVKKIGENEYLASYFTSTTEVDPKQLKAFLEKKLVPYMVPSHYIHMDHFELSGSGKIDDKKLPDITLSLDGLTPPRNDMEQELFDFCADLMGFTEFGVTNGLKSVGLTSLSFINIAVFVLEKYQVELKLTELMHADCTIERICELIQNSGKKEKKVYEVMDDYPLTPQQLPFTVKQQVNDIYRIVTFGQAMDTQRLREALLQVINATPYLFTTFSEENGAWSQKRNDAVMELADIPVVQGEATDEVCNAFCKPFDLCEERLFSFVIYEQEEDVTLLMHIHHILIDHEGMKTFYDRVMKVYENPDAKINEETDYFTYILELKEKEEQLKQAGRDAREQLCKELGTASDTQAPKPFERGFTRRMLDLSGIRGVLSAHGISISDLMLAAVGQAAAKTLHREKLLINNTFGGRNDADYFHTIGYFPFSVPMIAEAGKKDILDTIGHETLEAIEHFSAYDDAQYLRLCRGEFQHPFIVYNYMEAFDAGEGAAYKIRNLQSSEPVSDDRCHFILPQLEFNCLSGGSRGIIMLEYDTSILSAEEAEALLSEAEQWICNAI